MIKTMISHAWEDDAFVDYLWEKLDRENLGLVLNYTPWGIKLYPVLVSVTLFIVVTAATGWYQQRQLTVADRFNVTFQVGLPRQAAMTKPVLSFSIG